MDLTSVLKPGNELLLLSFRDTKIDPEIVKEILSLNDGNFKVVDVLLVFRDEDGKTLYHDLWGMRAENPSQPGEVISTVIDNNPKIIQTILNIAPGGWAVLVLIKHLWINTLLEHLEGLGACVSYKGLVSVSGA